MSNKFVFVIPVYNCEDTIQQTLMSIFAQSYPHWRVMLRDDLSTDKTVERAEMLVDALGISDRVKVFTNREKHGEVRNTLEAAKDIDQDEIICRVDGGDWLTDNDTLAFLDSVYSDEKVGCVWTAHRWAYSPKNISGPLPSVDCDVYKELLDNWVTSHMKTWRKSIMNSINNANYLDADGKYIMIACDRAIYLPILHRAKMEGLSRRFMPICAYHYSINLKDPELFTNERSLKQRQSAEFIHNRGYIE